MTEGPFGPAADIGVGFSDVALLVASVTGFCFLAVGVYAIVLVRLKSRADMQKSEGEDGYDEQLANADAATLNRAQRRARARATMKMQRRIAPIVPGQRDNIQAIGAVGEEGEGESIRHLSRKERQKAAKLVEKDERRLFEEERRKQHLELQDATKRLKEEKEILDERRRDEEKIAKNAVEEEQRNRIEDEWLTFLTCSERKETVYEWVREIKASRSVALDIIAKDFGVSQTVVKNRIQELIEERRVAGIISNDGRFIHLSDNELHKIAARLRKLGSFSMKDIAAMRKAVASE